ncbi:MAG TPA: sensor histidine kinase [Candidatus Sulfopaludibacter sp.]|jgi:signal transduction histidine kinase|nr:sensor histidine kinase [Candidatus Sulfopaludibacter sp.]
MGSKTRLLLVCSLGGLILLTALAGVAALLLFQRARSQEEALRARYLERRGQLEELRDSIYLSGSLARDYFVETDDAEAAALQAKLVQLQEATRRSLNPQSPADASLRGEVTAWWRLLDLMSGMSRTHRSAGLDAYFRRQLAQRREAMLNIAGQIDTALSAEWKSGEAGMAAAGARFRTALTGGLVLVVALGLLLSVVTVRRVVHLEREARVLATQLVRAQEDERRAISRELHDEVGQSLSRLLLDAGKAAAAVESVETHSRLESMAALTERTVEAVRRIALSLRPSMLDDLGLVPALEWQARDVSRRIGINIEVNAEDSAGDVPDSHRTCIYRVAQEALQNCARHSGAGRISVALDKAVRSVSLCVQDDGRGFQVGRTRGLGLLGMEERVAQLGGRFRVQSAPGHGTTIRAELPL